MMPYYNFVNSTSVKANSPTFILVWSQKCKCSYKADIFSNHAFLEDLQLIIAESRILQGICDSTRSSASLVLVDCYDVGYCVNMGVL